MKVPAVKLLVYNKQLTIITGKLYCYKTTKTPKYGKIILITFIHKIYNWAKNIKCHIDMIMLMRLPGGSPYRIVANVLDCDIIVNEFEL